MTEGSKSKLWLSRVKEKFSKGFKGSKASPPTTTSPVGNAKAAPATQVTSMPSPPRPSSTSLTPARLFTGSLHGHTASVAAVAFSPDGRRLASGAEDNTIRLWDTTAGKLIKKLEGHQDYVHSVAFHPRGTLLASASYDRTVRVWAVAATSRPSDLLQVFLLEACGMSVSYSPSGTKLACADGAIRLFWNPGFRGIIVLVMGLNH